jgi:murein DD-endopeptidase MepM/ murein hydrolase activator NlpD
MAMHAQSQPDTSAIGGPEVMTPYAEGYNTVLPASENGHDAWIAEDSARFIPGHALYGEFDTEVIFERSARANSDSTVLELSTSPCDHVFPVCGQLNSAFGPRHRRMHYGVDIDLERGDPVVCAFEGVVRISRFHKQFGNVVVVRHSNGLETLYGHLSERLAEVGDHLEAGEVLGLGGSTGRSTGDHLHFETRYQQAACASRAFRCRGKGESGVASRGLYGTSRRHAEFHRTPPPHHREFALQAEPYPQRRKAARRPASALLKPRQARCSRRSSRPLPLLSAEIRSWL